MRIQLLAVLPILAVAILPIPGCSSGSTVARSLSKEQVAKILAAEGIGQIAIVEQQPQSDGTIALLVESNRRATAFGGCLADRSDLEVVLNSGGGWVVSSISRQIELSLFGCEKANTVSAAHVSGHYSEDKVGRAVSYFNKMISGALQDEMLIGPTELKCAAKDVRLGDVQGIIIQGDDVEFQVVSESLLPRLLGIRFSFDNERLEAVYLNDTNSIEVVEP